jgi:hypothetical protein
MGSALSTESRATGFSARVENILVPMCLPFPAGFLRYSFAWEIWPPELIV